MHYINLINLIEGIFITAKHCKHYFYQQRKTIKIGEAFLLVTNCSLSKPQLCNPRIQYSLMDKLLNSLKLSQHCAEVDRDGSIKQFLENASDHSPQSETKPNHCTVAQAMKLRIFKFLKSVQN